MTPSVSRLPLHLRVLRACAWCGKHALGDAEFLGWLEKPSEDFRCQHCGQVKKGIDLADVEEVPE